MIREAFLAELTGVRFLSRVCPHVDRQVDLEAERPLADVAGERFLTRVNAQVDSHLRVAPEGFTTDIAGNGPQPQSTRNQAGTAAPLPDPSPLWLQLLLDPASVLTSDPSGSSAEQAAVWSQSVWFLTFLPAAPEPGPISGRV